MYYTVFMFGLIKNMCKMNIISISQAVNLSQKDSFFTVSHPPKKSSRPEIRPWNFKETYFECILHCMLVCLGYFFAKQNYVRGKLSHYLQMKYEKISGHKCKCQGKYLIILCLCKMTGEGFPHSAY